MARNTNRATTHQLLLLALRDARLPFARGERGLLLGLLSWADRQNRPSEDTFEHQGTRRVPRQKRREEEHPTCDYHPNAVDIAADKGAYRQKPRRYPNCVEHSSEGHVLERGRYSTHERD